jgi:formylglycine-generating enzyme required for sulfatase activity
VDVAAIIAGIKRDMVQVKGGTFTMGCLDGRDGDCDSWGKPTHQVTLSDYAIGKTEVTVAQYMAFVNETKTHYPEWLEPGGEYNIKTGSNDYYKSQLGKSLQNPDCPIVGISWNDATAFCAWLSGRTGIAYRLPTEAEWEFAARGGNAGKGFLYAGSNEIDEVAWYYDNSGEKTHPVARKKPNELGLYDMSGNVWEWCGDWYGDYTETDKPVLNPRGPEEGIYRVIRGGSWDDDARYCRASYRFFNEPVIRNLYLGFRLAAAAPR